MTPGMQEVIDYNEMLTWANRSGCWLEERPVGWPLKIYSQYNITVITVLLVKDILIFITKKNMLFWCKINSCSSKQWDRNTRQADDTDARNYGRLLMIQNHVFTIIMELMITDYSTKKNVLKLLWVVEQCCLARSTNNMFLGHNSNDWEILGAW